MQWQDINYESDSFWAGRHTVVKNGVYNENGKKIGDKLVIEDSGKTPQAERELPLGTFLANIKNILIKVLHQSQQTLFFIQKLVTHFMSNH